MFGLAIGDRIRLLEMPDDPCPIPVGTTGTVIGFCDSYGIQQVKVVWDIERSLYLVPGVDRWEKIAHAPVV